MRHRLVGDLLPPALMLLAGTVFFYLTGADIEWMRPLTEAGKWPGGEFGFWKALYRVGTFPAILAAGAAILVLLAGFRSARWARFRRHALFLVLLMAIGPGLLANAVLKDHWGRPRPREVVELGGHERFEPVLSIDPASKGKSFPCGHATMGFFFVAGYYLLRARRRMAAGAFLVGGLVSGGLIGWARVVQGGHFPSDVLWAGGIVWGLAALLAHWLRVGEIPPEPAPFRPAGWWTIAGATLLVPALAFLGLLALPIESRTTYAAPENGPVELTLKLVGGKVRIAPGERTSVGTVVRGFGLPGSGIKSSWTVKDAGGGRTEARLKQRASGLTTELGQEVEVQYRPDQIIRLKLELPDGHVEVALPELAGAERRSWDLKIGSGDVLIRPSSLPADIEVGGLNRIDGKGERDRVRVEVGPAARCRIEPGR
jgi:membrane-associated PAP2 superfamily phosphatase